MTAPVTTTVVGNDVTFTITIPLPAVKLPSILSKFPPKINLGNIPNPIPKALEGIGQALAYIIKVIEKLVALIPDASIRLIIKVGPATVLDQKISTTDLVGLPYT